MEGTTKEWKQQSLLLRVRICFFFVKNIIFKGSTIIENHVW